MKTSLVLIVFYCAILASGCSSRQGRHIAEAVPQQKMEAIYEEIKTPFKYGVVFKHPDSTQMLDSPTIFREHNKWYMTYIVFDGKGYETHLAESNDLLDWKARGKILSFTQNTWDANQKAGYVSLVDIAWAGSYQVSSYDGKYWLSYLGGATAGYEAGKLGIGIATSTVLTQANEWKRLDRPVLLPSDTDAR